MNCPYCNSWNPDNAVTCSGCGQSLGNSSGVLRQVANAPSPAPHQNPQPGYQQPNYTPPQYNSAAYYTNVPHQGVVYYNAPAPKPEDPGNGFAITSMILGILSFVLCTLGMFTAPLAIIFGAVAKGKGNKSGMGTAGLTCGIIVTVFWVLYIVFMIVVMAASSTV